MEQKNQLLLAAAARLYSLGLDVEGARETLRQYVDQGEPWSSPRMAEAYRDFTRLRRQFDQLEAQYLELRGSSVSKQK